MQFTAAGGALDDDDDALFLPQKFAKSATPVTPATAASPVMPTGDVPDARVVGYHCVNPSFESEEAPLEIFRALLAALEKNGVKGTPRADWTVRVRLAVDDGSASPPAPSLLAPVSLT